MNKYLCGHNNPPHPTTGKSNNGYRGCCYKCWQAYKKQVAKGETTWEALMKAGKCGPSLR